MSVLRCKEVSNMKSVKGREHAMRYRRRMDDSESLTNAAEAKDHGVKLLRQM